MNAARLVYLNDVAKAANVAPKTISQWIVRGLPVLGDHDVAGDGPGRPRMFSFETTFQVVVAAELIRFGADVASALTTAVRVTSMSGPGEFRAAPDGSIVPASDRPFGSIWAEGRSYLVTNHRTAVVVHAPSAGGIKPLELAQTLLASEPQHCEKRLSFALIDLTELHGRVSEAFGERGLV